jgi:hypothetical protein
LAVLVRRGKDDGHRLEGHNIDHRPSFWEGHVMGLWPRIGVTVLATATAAAAAAAWLGMEAAGAGQAAGLAVASIVATVAVTLGGAWASRAGDAGDLVGAGGVVVPGSLSGQVIGRAEGAVFGPHGNFAGATIITGAGVARQDVAPGQGGPGAGPGPGRLRRGWWWGRSRRGRLPSRGVLMCRRR